MKLLNWLSAVAQVASVCLPSHLPLPSSPSYLWAFPNSCPLAVLPHFMGVCSSEEWFGACTALLKESRAVDVRTLEKLSIILQRLSTIKWVEISAVLISILLHYVNYTCRANRRMFEAFQLPILMQELLHKHANPDNPFLTLNLQSILLNLTSKHWPQ